MEHNEDFETWWNNEGSVPPEDGVDLEEHTKRKCAIAWANGSYKALERTGTCKDCKHYVYRQSMSAFTGPSTTWYCDLNYTMIVEDYYCADFKRKGKKWTK